MKGLETLGGTALLAGGLIFLLDAVAPSIEKWENIGRLLILLGAGAWVVGKVL